MSELWKCICDMDLVMTEYTANKYIRNIIERKKAVSAYL